jgi:hypothetical protein
LVSRLVFFANTPPKQDISVQNTAIKLQIKAFLKKTCHSLGLFQLLSQIIHDIYYGYYFDTEQIGTFDWTFNGGIQLHVNLSPMSCLSRGDNYVKTVISLIWMQFSHNYLHLKNYFIMILNIQPKPFHSTEAFIK